MTRRLVVWHRGYGCDTGCCGHTVTWHDEEQLKRGGFDPWDAAEWDESCRNFSFSHPCDEDRLRWAQEFVEAVYGSEHVADLDWEHSIVSDD